MTSVRLRIEPQGEPPLFLELAEGRYLVGRGSECEVQIDHDGVSRRHALLVIEHGAVAVEDLYSSNGTRIDGMTVEEVTPFFRGQVLSLGHDAVRLEFGDEPSEVIGAARFKQSGTNGHPADLFHSNYIFKSEIARGGMGTVLEAEDANTGRTVAIKKMLQGSAASAEAQFRFQQEARVMGCLEHANIVPMHELGVNENGVPFYTMKRVRGETLQTLLRGIRDGDPETMAGYPLARLLEVFQKVCDGVAFAHSRGVVHRDLKPENVLVGGFGEVMLLDWGLAKVLPGSPLRSSVAGRIPDILDVGGLPTEVNDDASRSGLFRTRDGAVIGTPNYMPPEQAEGKILEVDQRSDIFSLGGILYSILTLRPPVTGDDVGEVLTQMREGYIPPPVIYNKVSTARLPGAGDGDEREIALRHCPGGCIPEALSRVAMRAMAKEPAARYQEVRELQSEVEAWLNGRVTRAEEAGVGRQFALFVARHRRAAMAGLLVLVCGVLFLAQSVRERRKLEEALVELRKGVPLIEAEVRGLVTAGDFEHALARMETLLVFLPDNSSHQLQRARLLQTLARFEEAEEGFNAARDAGADGSEVAPEIAICRELAARVGPEGLDREGYARLVNHLVARQRFAEAKRLALAHGLNPSIGDVGNSLAAIRSLLRGQGASEEMVSGLQLDDAGRLTLDLSGRPVVDLAPLTGVPFEVLELAETRVTDLRPLKGMPLQSLNLANVPVFDLEPLAGAPLQDLNLSGASVVTLADLDVSALETLDISGTKVTDLTPLRGAPLRNLDISRTAVSDLTPLAAARLDRFVATRCSRLRSVAALADMPLSSLDLAYTSVADLTPLIQARVRRVDLSGIPATDFTPIRAWRLNAASLHDTKLMDLALFRGMALEELHAARIPARDFAPLAGLPLRRLTLSGTAIVDLSPLIAMSLDHLDLSLTRVTDLSPLAQVTVDSLMLHGCNGVQDWHVLQNVNGLRRLSAPLASVPKQAQRRARVLAQLTPEATARERDVAWRDTAHIEAFWRKFGRSTAGKRQ